MKTIQISFLDTKLSKAIADFITKNEYFNVISVSSNGDFALTNFISKRPDILLLDYELSTRDGLKIINLIDYMYFKNRICKVYVFSQSHRKVKNTAVVTSLKMPDSFEVYKNIVKKIYRDTNSSDVVIKFSAPHTLKDWNTILVDLGFSVTNAGTKYLAYVLFKIDSLNFSLGSLYEATSKHFKVTIEQVKWSIDKAVKNMRELKDVERIYKVLPNYDGREITPKYLIIMLVDTYYIEND